MIKKLWRWLTYAAPVHQHEWTTFSQDGVYSYRASGLERTGTLYHQRCTTCGLIKGVKVGV